MSKSWPPAPTVEDCDDNEVPPHMEVFDAIPSLEDAVAPQQTTSVGTSTAALNESLSSTKATTMPGFWPPAPTVEDCDDASPVASDYEDMPSLEEAAVPQQPVSSGTSATAPGGPTPSNAQNNANTQPLPPFLFPFMPANMGAAVIANADPAGQSMSTQFLANMLAQTFGSLAGLPPGTAPSQPTVPPATNPLASMADLMSALNGQHQTVVGQDDEEDESEDDDGDMPALEAAPPSAPDSILHSKLATEPSQDDEDEWDDVDDDMPSLEAAPPLAPPGQPGPHPPFPPLPVPHQTPLAAAISSFAQSLASAVQNPQNTPSGANPPQPTGSQGTTPAAPNATNSATSAPAQGGPATPLDMPLPFPFPGAFQVSMGTISTGGPDGVQFTATTVPVPQSLNNIATGLQQVMATMSNSDLENALQASFGLEGPLPSISDIINMAHPAFAPGPPFNATDFVDSLERVDIANIAEEDMRCPHCWLPFGTTDEDDPDFVFTPDRDEVPANAERQVAFHEMPFCTARPDNDPVRTPCGHIFGRGCLIETLERVNTRCPTCRQEFRQQPGDMPGAL